MIMCNMFPGGRRKALTLSYDDGIAQDIRLIEIMKKHGLKGTFNLNGGLMDGITRNNGVEVRRLLPEEVAELYQGFEIAVHGYKHLSLGTAPMDMRGPEIVNDRLALEKLAGYPVRGMAYANGSYNRAVMEQLRSMGILYARVVPSSNNFLLPNDFLEWYPTCHHNAANLQELCDAFLKPPLSAASVYQVFYLWGHSYEFDIHNNWEVIERFAEYMGGRDEIWYATNMEIYEYVQAQRALISSCDGSILKNPTGLDVWVSKDGEALRIPAGQTVRVEG